MLLYIYMKPRVNIIWTLDKSKFKKIVLEGKTYCEILRTIGCRTLGVDYDRLKKRIREDGINTDHIIKGQGHNKFRKIEGLNKETIIARLHIYDVNEHFNMGSLRRQIIKHSIIPYKCECGNEGEWRGNSLSLQLDHMNGNRRDQRKENLRFLCPNCHSQTSNHGSKNKFRS
jgi:predicted RNA-binding Zn-ribbon protein involved in translation (DUF1610 family)